MKLTKLVVSLIVVAINSIGCVKDQCETEGFNGRQKIVACADLARKDIENFEIGLNLYRLKKGRFPNTSEGLVILCSEGLCGEKFVRNVYSRPRDPWDGYYVYIAPSVKSAKGFDITSYGPDGYPGGGDDITN